MMDSLQIERLLDRAPVGCLVTTADGLVVDTNDTVLAWLGRTREEVIGAARFDDFLPAGQRVVWQTHQLAELERTGELKGAVVDLNGRSGTVPALLTATLIHTDGDRPLLGITLVDATERRAYERQLLVARRAAEEAERRLRVLQRITGICAGAGTERDLLEELAQALAHGLGASGVATWLGVPVAPGLFGAVARQELTASVAPDFVEAKELGTAGPELIAGDIVVAGSPADISARLGSLALPLLENGLDAAVLLPFFHDGHCLGLGLVCFTHAWDGGEQDLDDLRSAAALVGEAIARINAQERLRRLATHDTLTGLPNRHQLSERLEEALLRADRTLSPVSVVFVDLDGFKDVNDTLGHAAGDAVLVEVAERINGAVRDVDFVARLAGDEFVVVCEDSEPEAAATVAERIHAAMSRPMRIMGKRVKVGASLGTAVRHPGTPRIGADWLLAEADRAMYDAKEAGRGRR